MNTQEKSTEKPVITKKQKIINEVKSITLIVLIVFGFRSTFFEPFKIPSGSMIPTLMIGDFILVNKFSYGFKIPFVDMFSDPVYITGPKMPERGDVIVFKYPKQPSMNYIKRVIGVPGDTIEIKDKIVYINEQAVPTVKVDGKEIMADMDDKFKNDDFSFFEAKLGNTSHILQYTSAETNNHSDRIKVPDNHLFVMGDNRDYSADSRIWGFVPFNNVKGKAILVWFSAIFPWNEDNPKLRTHRIGVPIN